MIIVTLGAEEVFFRMHAPRWASQPMSGMGAAHAGGRFNRPGQEALYLSRDTTTAIAEYQQDNPWLQPGTLCSYFASGLRLADLSNGYDPDRWAELWADHACDWRRERFDLGHEPPTWYMSDDVIAERLDGMLFPSQANPGGINLVIFDTSTKPSSQLRVHDPSEQLPKDQASWR